MASEETSPFDSNSVTLAVSFLALSSLIVYCLIWHTYFITIVKSDSMRPSLNRGDILISSKIDDVSNGEIVLVITDNLKEPICHRVVRTRGSNENQLFMSKGDNNAKDDQDLLGAKWISVRHIQGRVTFVAPYVGLPVLYIKETVMGKCLLALSWGLLLTCHK